MPDTAAQWLERVKPIVHWEGAPPNSLDAVQLIMFSPKGHGYRVFVYCDEPPVIVAYSTQHPAGQTRTPADDELHAILDRAAAVPWDQWTPETSVNRKGKPGFAVSMSATVDW